jgi:arsenate reductase
VFSKLGMTPRELLRKRDATKAGLSGNETDEDLIRLMVGNPRLLQRPIGVLGNKAAVGRPVENLLGLV